MALSAEEEQDRRQREWAAKRLAYEQHEKERKNSTQTLIIAGLGLGAFLVWVFLSEAGQGGLGLMIGGGMAFSAWWLANNY